MSSFSQFKIQFRDIEFDGFDTESLLRGADEMRKLSLTTDDLALGIPFATISTIVYTFILGYGPFI